MAVVIVENLEVFLHLEETGIACDLAVYAAGRMSERLLAWLASPAMSGCSVLHCGDYDPVGLQEYLRLRAACGSRASLYVPDDLMDLLRTFGKRELLSDSPAVLRSVRASSDVSVRHVLRLIDEAGCGLEQEALLLGRGPVE